MYDRIFKLRYLPMLTPYNLIENIKLENYVSIDYSKHGGLIVCKMSCYVENELMQFIYEFSMDEHIQSVYYYKDGKKVVTFDRTKEHVELCEQYIAQNKYSKLG